MDRGSIHLQHLRGRGGRPTDLDVNGQRYSLLFDQEQLRFPDLLGAELVP
jgi:hypothetical protein